MGVGGGRGGGGAGAGQLLDHARAQQPEQAAQRLVVFDRHRLRHLARAERAVHAGEHLDVGRRQREVLEAQQRVGREAQGKVEVADPAADHLGVAHAVHGLQDHVAGGDLERRFLGLERDQRLEAVGAVRPGEDAVQDLAHLVRHPLFQPVPGQDRLLDQDLAQALLRALRLRRGLLELLARDEAVQHQHLAQPVFREVGAGMHDLAVAEEDAAVVAGTTEVEVARLAADVQVAEERRQCALGEGALVQGHVTVPAPTRCGMVLRKKGGRL
jgi:hypothetical protein